MNAYKKSNDLYIGEVVDFISHKSKVMAVIIYGKNLETYPIKDIYVKDK